MTTEKTDDIQTLVRAVAEWYGWLKTGHMLVLPNVRDMPSKHDYCVFVDDNLPDRTATQYTVCMDQLDGFSVIIFAAYAKAEMAKRGYFWDNDTTPIDSTNELWCWNGAPFTRIQYDPADPLSEGTAILRAIADIAEGEG